MLVLLFEWDIPTCFLRLTHNLNLDTLRSDVVEYQLAARNTFGVDPAPNADLDIFEMLASLDRFISRKKVSQVGGNFEFMGIGIGSFALSELLDLARSDFEILL